MANVLFAMCRDDYRGRFQVVHENLIYSLRRRRHKVNIAVNPLSVMAGLRFSPVSGQPNDLIIYETGFGYDEDDRKDRWQIAQDVEKIVDYLSKINIPLIILCLSV